MNSLSRRQLTLSLLGGTLSAGFMGGCSTSTNIFGLQFGPTEEEILEKERLKIEKERLKILEQENEARLAALPITHPERQDEFDELWRHLLLHTEAIPISDNRVRIRSLGTSFAGDEISEQNFLLRAAAESLLAKKDGFVVLHIEYYNEGLSLPSITPSLGLSSRRWIGNYEDLLENRNEQNLFSSRRRVKNKGMDGVILLVNKDEFPNRDRFTALEVYINLLNHQSK